MEDSAMKHVSFGALIIILTIVTLVTLSPLTGCQAGAAAGGGGGGGQNADAAAGQATYNQVCAQCHGTPGANDGMAPDLTGTSAAAIEAEVTGDNHGGGRIEGFQDRHYQELAAYLAGGAGGDGGADGGGDGAGEGGDAGGGTDVTAACHFASAADIQSIRQSVQTDFANGISRDQELLMMSQGCQLNPNVSFDDCMACANAIVDEVYP
jgi:cytochrome c553